MSQNLKWTGVWVRLAIGGRGYDGQVGFKIYKFTAESGQGVPTETESGAWFAPSLWVAWEIKSSLENDSAIRICLEYFCEPKTELFHSILASGILEMLRSCSYFPIGQRESTIWVINLLAMCLLFFWGVMAPNPQKQRNPTILGRPGHPFIWWSTESRPAAGGDSSLPELQGIWFAIHFGTCRWLAILGFMC